MEFRGGKYKKKSYKSDFKSEFRSKLVDNNVEEISETKKEKHQTFIRRVPSTFLDEDDFKLDCPNYPFVPTILPAVDRIIVIGDIHGDLDLAIRSFKLANLIDDNYNWIADPSNTVVIQVGDQVDSCRPIPGVNDCHNQPQESDKAEDMAVIDFFNRMHKLASNVGGAVYSLLGNHELMNADNDFRYVSHANYYEFNYEIDNHRYVGSSGRRNAFKPGGSVAKMLACTRNSVMIIGSNMFVHAGVLPILIDRITDVDFDSRTKLTYLNAIVRKWLLKQMSELEPNDISNKKLFINDTTLSPFWTRIYGQIKPGSNAVDNFECENSVGKALKVFKIGKIVVGHTPQLLVHGVGINGTCYEKDAGGNLWRVDGGFSKAFGVFGSQNIIEVLEILNDKEFIVHKETTTKYTESKLEKVITEPYIEEIKEQYSQGRIKYKHKKKKN